MKTILLDVWNETVHEIEVENTLQAFYDELQCNYIEIVRRKIGGKYYEVMCDEEGTFVESPKISAINDMGQPMFVGNLMFFNDGGEDLAELTAADIKHIKAHIQTMCTMQWPQGYPMLTQCDF